MHKKIGRATGRQAETDRQCLLGIPGVETMRDAFVGSRSGASRDRHTDSVWKGYLVMIPCVMPFLAAEMRKKRQV